MRFCPFAQRTRLVLSAKGIKWVQTLMGISELFSWYEAFFCCAEGVRDIAWLKSFQTCFEWKEKPLWIIVFCPRHDIVNINLKNKPDWFLEKNPLGLVPTLETPSGQVIYESPITCDYLDEVYPEKKLLPSDPFEKAQQKMLLEHFSKVFPNSLPQDIIYIYI